MRNLMRAAVLAGAAAAALALAGCTEIMNALGLGDPSLVVSQGSTIIKDGDTFDIGSTIGGTSSIPVEFTILNAGHGEMTLGSGAVTISGADAADFAVETAPPDSLSIGSTGDFSVVVSPGQFVYSQVSAEITVTDGNGNTLTFTMTGSRFPS
jgi:hypothetical protein